MDVFVFFEVPEQNRKGNMILSPKIMDAEFVNSIKDRILEEYSDIGVSPIIIENLVKLDDKWGD